MTTTTVVKARQKGVTGYVNVCRPTDWGNPFPIGPLHSRTESLDRYAVWLSYNWQTSSDFQHDALALQGKTLGCTCSQSDIDAGLCHAVLLARFVDMKAEEVASNKGGRREGAGKPAEEPGNSKTVLVSARVSEQDAEEIDKARGKQSRSEWIRAAILAYMEGQNE